MRIQSDDAGITDYVKVDSVTFYKMENYDYADTVGTKDCYAYKDDATDYLEMRGTPGTSWRLYPTPPSVSTTTYTFVKVDVAGDGAVEISTTGANSEIQDIDDDFETRYAGLDMGETTNWFQMVMYNVDEHMTVDRAEIYGFTPPYTWGSIDTIADDVAHQSTDGVVMRMTSGDEWNIEDLSAGGHTITTDDFMIVRTRASRDTNVRINVWFYNGAAHRYPIQNYAVGTSWITICVNLGTWAGQDIDQIRMYAGDTGSGTDTWLEVDYIKVVTYDVDEFTITIQDLAFTTPSLTEFSGERFFYDVATEDYADTLYNVTSWGTWLDPGIQDGSLVPVNNTGGDHDFTAYSVDRLPFDGDWSYFYLENNVAGSYTVLTQADMYIVFYDQQGHRVDFDLFNVFVDGTQIYHDVYSAYEEEDYTIVVRDRWDTLIDTDTYDWEPRIEIELTIYSFKVYSYNSNFIYYNLTLPGSLNYWSEYIAPLEVVEYNLFADTYGWEAWFIGNGTSASGTVTIPDATYGDYAQIITDNTVNDLLTFWDTTYITTQQINLTTTNIYDDTVVIQLMFDWTNTTIYNQTVTIEAMFNWGNTTIYNQTINILSAFNATNTNLYQQTVNIIANVTNINSTIHSQIVTLLADISNVNSTLYAQTVTLLADIQNVNTTIYTQTITMLADISNVNSTIYAQTVQLLADISNVNTTIYAQTVTLLADIFNTNSTIHAQIVTLLADISNVNSTLYTQTVTLIADIANVNSTLYTQTVTLLADISNVNTTIYAQTIQLLADISNVNSTLYTQTLNVLTNLTNINTTLYNQGLNIITYVLNINSSVQNQTIILLNAFAEVYGYSGADFHLILSEVEVYEMIYATFITNWGNASVTCYIDNVQRGAMVNESVFLEWSKIHTFGVHELSFRINSSLSVLWYNNSYVISEYLVYLSVYSDIDGFGIFWENFQVYINSVRVYDMLYYSQSDAINVTILSFFDEVLYQADHVLPSNTTNAWSLDIPVALYDLQVFNSGRNSILCNITRNGITRSILIGAGEIVGFRIPALGYTVDVWGLEHEDGAVRGYTEVFSGLMNLPPIVGGIITNTISFFDLLWQDPSRISNVSFDLTTVLAVLFILFMTVIISTVILYMKFGGKEQNKFEPVQYRTGLYGKVPVYQPKKKKKNDRRGLFDTN